MASDLKVVVPKKHYRIECPSGKYIHEIFMKPDGEIVLQHFNVGDTDDEGKPKPKPKPEAPPKKKKPTSFALFGDDEDAPDDEVSAE